MPQAGAASGSKTLFMQQKTTETEITETEITNTETKIQKL